MTLHPKTLSLRHHIVNLLRSGRADIVKAVSESHGLSPQAVRNHLNAMVKEGTVEVTGVTRARRYKLKALVDKFQVFSVDAFTEDLIWTEFIKPPITDLPQNVQTLWSTVVTEIVNNVVDHSESSTVSVSMVRTLPMTSVTIVDQGVGAFQKVRKALGLIDDRQAAFELSKGKITTAPEAHSGYGIYFSSRMVDVFHMASGSLGFSHRREDEDWLIETESPMKGTFVSMAIANDSNITISEVYDRYCTNPNDENDFGFHKTHVPLMLAQFGQEPLVSRSQAKRVLARVDRFSEVLLDFKGIDIIGQAFADEIFRVFPKQHPNMRVLWVNANPSIQKMIGLAHSVDLEEPKPSP